MKASQALLWDYLSTPGGLSCWQADSIEGNLDSGNFSLRWPQLGARLDLSVSEIEVGSRIVLRAGQNVLELSAIDGAVTLSHHGLQAEDDLAGFESSWNAALCLLEVAATKHPRKQRKVQWIFEAAPSDASIAHCFFTDRHALKSWLGASADDLKSGREYSLELFGGLTLSGDVLFAERDVCLYARELNDGAVILRTLPSPQGGRILAIGLSSWGDERDISAHLPSLKGALHRLSQLLRSTQH